MRWGIALGVVTGMAAACLNDVSAHDSWINHGGYKNSLGEFCCGDNDCDSPTDAESVSSGWVVANGYVHRGPSVSRGPEYVPFSEAVPSPDGKLWICRRSDYTRRCVFGPPPGS